MNAAASRLHGAIHAKALVYLVKKYPDLEWTIDEDLPYYDEEESKLKVRPDILGRDKTDNLKFAVEIAATSLKKDLGFAKLLYQELGVENYLVIDCNRKEIHFFELKNNVYVDSSDKHQEIKAGIWPT